MRTMLLFLALYCFNSSVISQAQPISRPNAQSNLFQRVAGSANTVHQGNKISGSFDLSVQTYHYFLITGRRTKNDSLHQDLLIKKMPIQEVYRGLHFFVFNRAAIDLDRLKSLANNYITSLQSSPLTLRLKKDFFLTKVKKLSPEEYVPVVALQLFSDARAIPYGNVDNKVEIGLSGHLYLGITSHFKRVEFDTKGDAIDRGNFTINPIIGIALANQGLMKTLTSRSVKDPILTSGCRFRFRSDRDSQNDFSLLLQYTLSEIIGPKLRAGFIWSSM